MTLTNKKVHLKKSMVMASLALALTACGGDSSSDNAEVLEAPVVTPNNAPVINSVAALEVEVDQQYSYTFIASDSDAASSLSLSASDLPSWLSFDADTGILSGTPTAANTGIHSVNLAVSDGYDIQRQVFEITVTLPENYNVTLENFIVFADNQLASWPAWDCCGDSTPLLVDAGDGYGNAIEFSIGETPTVMGFISRTSDGAIDPMPYNASEELLPEGTLSFDLKMTASPGDTTWMLKMESNGGASAIEVPLSTSVEAHAAPMLDTWQHHTFKIADLVAAGFDPTQIDVIMVFPQWDTGNGAKYLVDNVTFSFGDISEEENPEDPPEVEGEELIIFTDEMRADWSAWDCCAGSVPTVETDDEDHGSVAEFSVTGSGETVLGFSSRESHGVVGGMPFDASPIASTGTIAFELKLTASPGDTAWKFKVESNGGPDAGGQFVELDLFASLEGHAAPVLDTWQTYTFNISDLIAAGLDASGIDVVMVFPAWGTGSGAIYRIDNFAILNDGAVAPRSGNSGDDATTTTAIGVDFEGPQLTWESFDTAKVQYVDNPNSGGMNSSNTVALFDVLQGDGEWIGAKTEGIDNFELDSSNCIVMLDVYKDTISAVDVKFEKFNGDGWGSHGSISTPNTVVNQWETLTFNFCDKIGLPENDDIGAFVIFPDRTNARAQNTVNYVDNIMFSAGDAVVVPPVGGPTDAAPVPAAAEADVISVFSDSFIAVADVDTNPNWGQTTVTSVVDVAGNNTLKMVGLNYQGIQYATQDVSGKTTLHLDYWTADATAFDVYLIGAGGETKYTITATQNGWQSVDIPLSTFSGVVDLTDVFQFKFDAQAFDGGTIYLDNLYFGEGDVAVDPTEPAEPMVGAPVPVAADVDVISVFSDGYTMVGGVDTNPNWGQATVTSVIDIAGNSTLKMAGLNYQGIQYDTQDVSGKTTLHLDYWTADASEFQVFLISTGPAEFPYTITTTKNGWTSVDIPLSSFDGVDLADAFQFKFVGSGTVYIDNLYFQ